jgi:hypothetical protein
MADDPVQPILEPVTKPLSLIPVVIKEAALDSPTFRATAVHFGDQIDLIEKWLETYIKAISKLVHEMGSLQSLVDSYIQATTPPLQLSEAVIDHDYTVLALKRFGEGARDFWQPALRGIKRAETVAVEPLRTFLQNDLRMLKDARKNLEHTQRTFDGAIARYAGQAKTKEPSSLREDAFQLHEARRAYLKASMDFCVLAPQVRTTLDKLLVKVVSEQWRDMKSARDTSSASFSKYNGDMERVKGWSREMENGERVFKRELQMARQQVENSAEQNTRPTRDLDIYGASTVPYLGNSGPTSANLHSPAKPDPANEKAEKQGWLFQRTITGKPARTYWVRRWFFVKNGIFGWLAQGIRSGAVEESEKIGVLLCGIRPAFQEERRFCFEVKTKDTTILLQAETQNDLTEWISSFEVAKRKALEDTSKEISGQSVDAAFSISPAIAPEFAAKTSEGHAHQLSDDMTPIERSETLAIPGVDGLASRGSFDVTQTRRGTAFDRDGESSSRDHAARIMQKLDLTRKSTVGPQLSGSNPSGPATGGIASLISASLASASHNILPVNQIPSPAPGLPDTRLIIGQTLTSSSLAPATLASPPAPTNLSKAAVAVSGERGIGLGRSGGMPGGLMGNLWGSFNWGHISRLERGEVDVTRERSGSQSSVYNVPQLDGNDKPTDTSSRDPSPGRATPSSSVHRKTMSMGGTPARTNLNPADEFPNYYPLPLKVQDAQFRVLFPHVPRREKVVLVFRAMWNPTEQQEFPGRVYVTEKEIFFYSNHLGLVLITSIALASIDEVTAAPGRDCDFLYLHFKPGTRVDNATRITVKTFLEPLKLLERRLNFLVRNASTNEYGLEDIIKSLIKMESGDADHSPSAESWEDVSVHTPMDPGYGGKDVKASLRIDGNLFAPPGVNFTKAATKFKLPSHPVVYAPQGMRHAAVEKQFDISAKALFHVLFGDKSTVFPMLYRERWAQRVVQGPWIQSDGGPHRRDFEYEVAQSGAEAIVINDYQIIEVLNDHLCYVVADKKTPWYLPASDRFTLLGKIVITHVAKARCKLAVYTKVDWTKPPRIGGNLVERQGLRDLDLEAEDLVDIITEQVARLGIHNHTRKVLQIFGPIGQQTQATQFAVADIPPPNRPRKFKLRPRSLVSVISQLIGTVILNLISTMFSCVLTVVGGAGKVLSAHKLLVLLLLLSGCANFFYSSRDSYQWWNERNAAKYMSRLSVGPSTSMRRAVYLKDLEDGFLNVNDTVINLPGRRKQDSNQCHDTFASLLSLDSLSSALSSSPPTTRRLYRTRQNLGSHRHDLLVALRVVNRIEKEVIDAEYENWLLDETRKCERMRAILAEPSKAQRSGLNSTEKIESWVKTYCGDCSRELGEVRHRAIGLA